MRKFNLEGPVEAEHHYCIPPLDRVNLGEILERLADRRYFVLHAPRQTGKTSTLLALQDRLNAAGAYRCLYVNVEGGQAAKEDTARAMQTILGELGTRARRVLQDDFVERSKAALTAEYGPDACQAECLTRWAEREARLLVLLLDEIDALVGDTLISVLRQLRALRHAPRRIPAERDPVRRARRVRLPDLFQPGGGQRPGRQRFQHQGRIAALGELLQARGAGVAGAVHCRVRASLRVGGGRTPVGAELRPAVAGQRLGL